MLYGFGYLYKFVMFYFFSFVKEQKKKRFKKKTVDQNFVILIFLVSLKIGPVGPVDQQINLVSSKYYLFKRIINLYNAKGLKKIR